MNQRLNIFDLEFHPSTREIIRSAAGDTLDESAGRYHRFKVIGFTAVDFMIIDDELLSDPSEGFDGVIRKIYYVTDTQAIGGKMWKSIVYLLDTKWVEPGGLNYDEYHDIEGFLLGHPTTKDDVKRCVNSDLIDDYDIRCRKTALKEYPMASEADIDDSSRLARMLSIAIDQQAT